MTGEHISNPTPGVERKRGGRAKPDWSQPESEDPSPDALRQLRPQEHGGAPGPA